MRTAAVTRARPLKRTLLLATLCAVGLLVLAEGVLRVRERILYGTFARATTTVFVPGSGAVSNRPNTTVEGTRLSVHINSLGFRGREFETPKPRGRYRIICVGGSTTFDIYAPSDRETWPGLLESRLREKHPSIEVVNAGLAGHTLALSLTRPIWSNVEALEPDLLVTYHGSNEISELARTTFIRNDQSPPARSGAAQFLADHSLLAFKLSLLADLIVPMPEPVCAGELPASGVVEFEKNLRELTRRARVGRTPLVLATVGIRFSRGTPIERRQAVLRGAARDFPGLSPEAILKAYEAYNATIESVARETDAIVAPVAAALAGHEEFFGDLSHQSPRGSEVIARVVAETLEARSLLPDH